MFFGIAKTFSELFYKLSLVKNAQRYFHFKYFSLFLHL